MLTFLKLCSIINMKVRDEVMKLIGSLAVLFSAWGLVWGIFDYKFFPLTLVGIALYGLYFYGMKGEH